MDEKEEKNMTAHKFLFFGFSFIAFVYATKTGIDIFLNRNKVRETKGRIIDFEFVLPEAMMHRNAKIVTFEYYVDGKRYISKNSKRMSLTANIGDVMDIKYFINDPGMLYTKTEVQFYLSMFVSLICLLLGLIE